jgi:hypothetical protein
VTVRLVSDPGADDDTRMFANRTEGAVPKFSPYTYSRDVEGSGYAEVTNSGAA